MTRRRKDSLEKEADIVDAQLKILRTREAEFLRIVDDMQRLKDTVSAEREELEAKQKELHSERQPINWLPAELLIHIFLTFTEADIDSPDPTEVYHRAPVIISHVSSRWRSISLETSRMWSRISIQSPVWDVRPIGAFLMRSGMAPLDIVFISPITTLVQEEFRRAHGLLAHVSHDIGRIRSIAFQSRYTDAMQRLVSVLTLPDNKFSSLRSINLSVVSFGNSMSSQSLIPAQFQGFGSSLNLTHLRLEKLPPFNIPKHFLPNLATLEICFPPKKLTAETSTSYMLRMSHLVQFLNCTPKLEDLVLSNTVPYMDVALDLEDAVQIADGLKQVQRVELVHLRTLEWTYPFAPDMHHFLSFLAVPALEKIDVGIDELPVLRSNVLLLRGYPDTAASQLFASHRVIELCALRDLSLQCLQEDSIGSVLRKFAFPALEKLELAHVGTRYGDGLPTFPRLESMFRDPRLPQLTHLTICRFEISAELGKAEAMLGYVPALVSLTLDACAGVGKLFDGLQQRIAGAGAVRVCPRLEALALWRCADVDITALVGIVIARNGRSGGGAADRGTVPSDNGGGAANKGAPRAIRPMRKLRRQGQGAGDAGDPSSNILSSIIAIEEASRPARISSIRIEDCALIREEQALSLRALGVADVVWRSD
ncbi:hypothetical protein B0H17DRAFT_1000336 [Mycena rosella]|uniref:F-box domain-containing protein n=1 Tax=Mycena rosella TaxID=1033263 RepID=A0AAD7GZG4_MYCRO|nr:hypothetical protein B0H17DRAFT_1000336 [Mycena rosella]